MSTTAGERGRSRSTPAGRSAGPIFFAMAIIILAFVPVFALTGQEGKLFHPLAFTKTFAMIGSTLLAVTLVPVLCSLLVRGPFHAEDRNLVMRGLLQTLRARAELGAQSPCRTCSASAMLILAAALVTAFGLPPEHGEAASRGRAIRGRRDWWRGSARNSCRRSTKAACSSCRCCCRRPG